MMFSFTACSANNNITNNNSNQTTDLSESTNNVAENEYTVDTPIESVINDKTFGDYGRLIFPTQKGYYSGNTLGELQLTWYSEINPIKTVEIANYLKNHALNGDKIFHDIYSDEEKRQIPKRKIQGYSSLEGKRTCRLPYAMQAVHSLM